jgi:hypothetical protein
LLTHRPVAAGGRGRAGGCPSPVRRATRSGRPSDAVTDPAYRGIVSVQQRVQLLVLRLIADAGRLDRWALAQLAGRIDERDLVRALQVLLSEGSLDAHASAAADGLSSIAVEQLAAVRGCLLVTMAGHRRLAEAA